MKYSESIKKIIKEYEIEGYANDLLVLLDENKSRLISEVGEVKTSKFTGNRHLLGRNCIILLATASQRSYKLILGGIDSFNNSNSFVLVFCIRGILEAAGSLGFLFNKLSLFYNNQSTEKEIFDSVANLMLGSKKHTFKPAGEAINALTLIQHADKIFYKKFIPQEKESPKMLEETYDFISNFCHPNIGANSLCTYVDKKNDNFKLTAEDTINKREATLIGELVLVSSLLITFYDEIYKLVEDNEDMPNIIKSI